MISKILENGNLEVTVPIIFRTISGRKKIIAPNVITDGKEPLALALARAFRWQQYIDNGTYKNIKELAKAIGQEPAYVARTIRLRYLSPTIIHQIIHGTLPSKLSLRTLRQSIPDLWAEQNTLFLGKNIEN